MRKSVLSLLAAVLAGCDVYGPCTTEARPALVVHVRDSLSNHIPEPRDSVLVLAIAGAFRDSTQAQPWSTDELVGALAYERAGTYRVEVQAPRYQTWVQNSVQVTRDACHVNTVELTARLQPE